MMSIRSLADFNRSSLGGDSDWLIPPPSPPRPQTPGRHGERGVGTFNWPPARTSTWPHAGTFSWPRTPRLLAGHRPESVAGQRGAFGGCDALAAHIADHHSPGPPGRWEYIAEIPEDLRPCPPCRVLCRHLQA